MSEAYWKEKERTERPERRLAALEQGVRELAKVLDFGEDDEPTVHCNWVRDRLRALLNPSASREADEDDHE